jgi:hypothetical protein
MERVTWVIGNNGEYCPNWRHQFRKWSTVQWNGPGGQDFLDTLSHARIRLEQFGLNELFAWASANFRSSFPVWCSISLTMIWFPWIWIGWRYRV